MSGDGSRHGSTCYTGDKMTTVDARLARLEEQVKDMSDDLARIAVWVDDLRQRRAAWAPIETAMGRVLLICVGAVVPVALAIVGTWIRMALGWP